MEVKLSHSLSQFGSYAGSVNGARQNYSVTALVV